MEDNTVSPKTLKARDLARLSLKQRKQGSGKGLGQVLANRRGQKGKAQ